MIQVVCIGHSHRYAVESLLKMFFPSERFSQKSPGSDSVITRVKELGEVNRILVVASIGGKKVARHQVIPRSCEKEELIENLCGCCYFALSELTGKTLPWGMLTGVRPVKRVRRMLAEGATSEQILSELNHRFFVSSQKAALALQTAQVQDSILLPFHPKRYSLYLSIPFCPTRCGYCSFVSQAIGQKTNLIAPYLNLLFQELAQTAALADRQKLQLDCVYIGGGTPTILTAEQLEELLSQVKRYFPLEGLREWTVEAGRPDTITREKLEVLRRYGVRRICINPQSFSDTVLSEIGRKHTVQQTLEGYALAREVGFEMINMDFIAGLPGDTVESFSYSIAQAIALGAENITIHALSLKRSSDFHRDGVSSSDAEGMCANGMEQLLQSGYRPYYLYRQKSMISGLENVGYALPGTESPYNIAIMEENQTILACGAGSVTKLVGKDKIIRSFNYKYPMEYQASFQEVQNRRKEIEETLENLCLREE